MGRPRKPAARKPLAPKDSNVVHHQQPRLPDGTPQMMMDLNHREAERHIVAIREVRNAKVEGYLVQLQVALSMLSKEVRAMRLDEFVSRFCPDRELIRDPDSCMIELRHKVRDSMSFEFPTKNPSLQNLVQPTPCGLPFSSSTVKDMSRQMADKIAQDEPDDEEFLKFMESFRSSKFFHSNLTTPRTDGHSMTPKTTRLPKKGEALLSVNGSPLGVFEKDGIEAIPEECPRRARRRLRASVMLSNV